MIDMSDAISAGKSAEELRREEEAREILDRPGEERYAALVARFEAEKRERGAETPPCG